MVCSNVAVDLNTGIEELPASPSASFLAHSGVGVDFARSPAPPILTTPHSAPPRSRRPPSLAGLHSPHEIYRPAANQHNQLRIKTKIDTGKGGGGNDDRTTGESGKEE